MLNLSNPDAIFTHESDLDGFVSGLLLRRLAKTLFGAEPPLYAYNHHTWRQRSFGERIAWICDMSFEARLDKPGWIVIDHHATEATPKSAQLVHDISKSASLLCYELCQERGLGSPKLDRLVHLSNVADLFLEDAPDFELANDYASLVKTYQFWNLFALIEGEPERLLDHPLLEVVQVKRRIENPIGFEWSKANITELSPSAGFVDTVVGNINLIVHRLLEQKDTPYSVLVTLFRKGNGVIVASFRSRGGEAIKIAEKFQGGGHANAAGATLPRSVSQIADAILYVRSILNPTPRAQALNSLENLFDQMELSQKTAPTARVAAPK